MKTLLVAALAATSLGLTALPAQAGHCHHVRFGVPAYVTVRYSAPYLLETEEVGRATFWKVSYTRHGQVHRYPVTVVTYRKIYSDGSTQVYRRSYVG
jgi:hypothetical protein